MSDCHCVCTYPGPLPRCDNITISPQLLGELEASSAPLPRRLSPDMLDPSLSRLAMDKKTFEALHGADAVSAALTVAPGVCVDLTRKRDAFDSAMVVFVPCAKK